MLKVPYMQIEARWVVSLVVKTLVGVVCNGSNPPFELYGRIYPHPIM